MAEGSAKFIGIVTGAALIILGLGGIPLAVQANNMTNLALFTLSFFLGIGILGWAYKE
jgi:hypothetical protein